MSRRRSSTACVAFPVGRVTQNATQTWQYAPGTTVTLDVALVSGSNQLVCKRSATRRDIHGQRYTIRPDGSIILPVGARPPTFPSEPSDQSDESSDTAARDAVDAVEAAELTRLARARVRRLRRTA